MHENINPLHSYIKQTQINFFLSSMEIHHTHSTEKFNIYLNHGFLN